MSEALDVVMRFQSLMVRNLPEDGNGKSPEDRFAELVALIDPEFVLPVASCLPYGGKHVGVEGFLEMGRKFGETWNIVDHHREREFIDAGDGRVIALYAPVFQSRRTGRTVSFDMVEVITVRDGKLVSLVPHYFDTTELVRALSPDEVAGGE